MMNAHELYHSTNFWPSPMPTVSTAGIFYKSTNNSNSSSISGNSLIDHSSSYLSAAAAATAVNVTASLAICNSGRFQTQNAYPPLDAALAAFENQPNNNIQMCSDAVVGTNSILSNSTLGFSSSHQQGFQNTAEVAPFTNFHQFQNTLFGQSFNLNKMNFPQTLQQLTNTTVTSNQQNSQQPTLTTTLLPLTSSAQNIEATRNSDIQRMFSPSYNSLIKSENILQSQQNSVTSPLTTNLFGLSNHTTANRRLQQSCEVLDQLKTQSIINANSTENNKITKMSLIKNSNENLIKPTTNNHINANNLKAITIPLTSLCGIRNLKDNDSENGNENNASLSGLNANNNNSQSSVCLACFSAQSNGLHFGARTCAACAAFFRRSVSGEKNYICKRSQRCVIKPGDTNGYRKMCRACRMKRCLDIGMLPENVQNKRHRRDFYFNEGLASVPEHMTPMATPLNEFQANENEYNNQLAVATHQRQQNNDLKTTKSFLDSPQLHCLNSNLIDLQSNKSKQSDDYDSIESLITNKILQKTSQNSLLKLENGDQHFKLSNELQIKNDKIRQHDTQQHQHQQLYDLQKLRQQDQHYLIDLDQQNYKNLNECVKSTSNLIKNLINNNENKLKQDSEHCCTNNCASDCKAKHKDVDNKNDTLLMIDSNLSLHKPLKQSLNSFNNLKDETPHTSLVMPQQTILTNNNKSNNYVPLTAFSTALALTNNLNLESNVASSIFENNQQSIMPTSTTANMQEEQTFHIKNKIICNPAINNLSPSTFVNSITNQNQNAPNNSNNFLNNNFNFIDPFSSMHSQWLQSTDQSIISNSSKWFMPSQLAKHA